MNLFAKTERPILAPQPNLPWASGAVFNPGAWYDGARVHLIFRAVPAGYRRIAMPDPEPGEPTEGFDDYISYIGYAESTDGLHFTVRPTPFLAPDGPCDHYGVEDPRIACLDDDYLITYTALSHPAFGEEDGVRIALASTKNFEMAHKHGVVGPPTRDKDAVLFPRRIEGRIAMLHRITPDIQIIFFDDLAQLCDPPEGHWQEHLAHLADHVVMKPEAAWEEKKIGAGPTPIETDAGWLLIYHGVDRHHVYRAGLALLDRDDPRRVLARTAEPVLEPTQDFERYGDVNNVVFPEGACLIDGVLHVYYGAADRVVGHAAAPLADVLAALR